MLYTMNNTCLKWMPAHEAAEAAASNIAAACHREEHEHVLVVLELARAVPQGDVWQLLLLLLLLWFFEFDLPYSSHQSFAEEL